MSIQWKSSHLPDTNKVSHGWSNNKTRDLTIGPSLYVLQLLQKLVLCTALRTERFIILTNKSISPALQYLEFIYEVLAVCRHLTARFLELTPLDLHGDVFVDYYVDW